MITNAPLRARLDFSRACISVFDMSCAQPGYEAAPTWVLDQSAAQVLMDDLFTAGVRPTDGAGTAGSMAATQRHLSDMVRLLDTVLPVALRKDGR